MTLHSVWGDSAPPGNWDLKPDGTPSIMIGGRFHLINRPTTGGVVGAKLWIPTTGGTLPTAAKIYIYANDGMDGTPTAIKEIPVTASRGSWLEVFLDELIPFPAQDFPNRKITAFFELTPAGLYPFGANVRGSLTTVPSSTQPDLVWSDWRALYKIPADTSSVPTPSQDEKASYGVDLIITDDSSWVPPGGGPEVVFGETIVEENALSGTGRGIWFDGVTSETMPAFGRSTYVEPGSTIDFSVDYGTDFTFSIYRLGLGLLDLQALTNHGDDVAVMRSESGSGRLGLELIDLVAQTVQLTVEVQALVQVDDIRVPVVNHLGKLGTNLLDGRIIANVPANDLELRNFRLGLDRGSLGDSYTGHGVGPTQGLHTPVLLKPAVVNHSHYALYRSI